ncbi:MAG: DUF1003 domain-containing protein [Candidatus Pacebacteria bacterium]|nr:DUF1003 domain-containing protein [Candidatus Paceibacterota bacterium]MBP9839507.1 DUF1003 domain-containing protein [Candidatus Paceibacterota bacterium]
MNKEHMAFINLLLGDSSESRKKIFRSIRARSAAKRTKVEKVADWMTEFFGGINFLILNLIVFVFWIFINTGQITSISIFDPFPFNLLTMIVSLEAIILSVFVLISQNRSSKVGELREETHLQLNLISEREVTKLIKMTALLLDKHGVDLSKDPELQKMIRPVSEEDIERRLEKEIL